MILISVHDLTPLRRVEEMRADFVANASHELRTPLASLSGFIDTLQGPARDDVVARERFIGIMKGQAQRMARLIDDLLSLSRIELNAHVHPQTPIDVTSTVRQVADALQVLARDRGVTIAITAPPEPLLVPGDRDELTRVFENLIENALKYGAAGKRVELTLSRIEVESGSEAIIVVRDHGPGRPRDGPGNRPGARAGQAHPQPASRQTGDRERARRRCELHGPAAAGERGLAITM